MTIYDIAKQAGVSASTVSRVINNRPGINAQTRKRVQKLLNENHYTPNEAARGLVMQSSKIIGILIEDLRIEPSYRISLCDRTGDDRFRLYLYYSEYRAKG